MKRKHFLKVFPLTSVIKMPLHSFPFLWKPFDDCTPSCFFLPGSCLHLCNSEIFEYVLFCESKICHVGTSGFQRAADKQQSWPLGQGDFLLPPGWRMLDWHARRSTKAMTNVVEERRESRVWCFCSLVVSRVQLVSVDGAPLIRDRTVTSLDASCFPSERTAAGEAAGLLQQDKAWGRKHEIEKNLRRLSPPITPLKLWPPEHDWLSSGSRKLDPLT